MVGAVVSVVVVVVVVALGTIIAFTFTSPALKSRKHQ